MRPYYSKIKTAHLLIIAACVIFLSFGFPIDTSQNADRSFTKSEEMIPMRDGVKLYTQIYAPQPVREPLPFIFIRTPYGIGGAGKEHPMLRTSLKELADDGYIFVFQDIRGRYKSEGKFVMVRPPRDKNDPMAIDESTDTNDTIDWLLKSVPNNNKRVGVAGVSYGGWLTVMAMLDPHPALKAVSPQAPAVDMYMGDDFHHNGAFRLSYGFEYVSMMETSNMVTAFKFDSYDTYEWYLKLGALSNANLKYFLGKLPTWNDFVAHPNYDEFWQKQAAARYMTKVTVPTLTVAGWWDQEDFYGPLKVYGTLEPYDTLKLNYIVAGPWNHGGWAGGEGSGLGRIKFDSATGRHFREKIQAPWFAYFLKDKGKLAQTKATTFQTGTNKWMSYDEWPPRRNAEARKLYFHRQGQLSFDPPQEDGESEHKSYISDPAHPVPYRPRPIEPTYYFRGSGWDTWLVEDQRFAHLRPDVASWETELLMEDVPISGDIVANLFASTTGSDSDWIVKLIDVYPEEYSKDPKMGGYQLMVANDVFRGRFRKSFERPEPIVPNQVTEYTIDLHQIDHCFLKGHKIMVQVQSTWFPIIDRNPQKYVENIFLATDSDYQAATQRIYCSKTSPSHIQISVIKK